MPSAHLTDTQRPLRTITLAFLVCGCRTVYDSGDRHDGDIVVCPNLYTCDGHDGGWTTISQTLAGSLRDAVHARSA